VIVCANIRNRPAALRGREGDAHASRRVEGLRKRVDAAALRRERSGL